MQTSGNHRREIASVSIQPSSACALWIASRRIAVTIQRQS